MKCQFCGQELPDKAKFCFNCKKQIVCQQCGEKLIDGAEICIYCGTEINPTIITNSQNHIKYIETQTEKSFEASFSNETAGAVVETFASFLPYNRKRSNIIEFTNNSNEANFSEVENVTPMLLSSNSNGESTTNNETYSIDKIFKKRGENEIYLHETSLKANSKRDYAGRLTILYLYYNQIHGIAEVKRTEVNSFLEKTGLKNDGNYRKWLSEEKSLYNINNGSYCLCRAGEERAKSYLADIFDNEKTDGWKLGNSTKDNSKNCGTNKTSKNPTSYSFITELNLKPEGKDSLKNFVSKYKASSGAEYNLVFVYYLQNILGEKNIGPNHIYTCYKDLNVKFPSNIRQSLIDTKSKKGWIDTSNMNDIKMSTVGENAIIDLTK